MHTMDTPQLDISMSRRRLLAFVGWGSFAAFWGSIYFGHPAVLLSQDPVRTLAQISGWEARRLSGWRGQHPL
jgi:hypothetical protein